MKNAIEMASDCLHKRQAKARNRCLIMVCGRNGTNKIDRSPTMQVAGALRP